MKSFKEFVSENTIRFTNWKRPDKTALKHEYDIEYSIKPLKAITKNAFPTLQVFLDAAGKAKVVSLSKSMDAKIAYRSHTKDKNALISLIKNYSSYPKYRNGHER